jgi:hypothetical protein
MRQAARRRAAAREVMTEAREFVAVQLRPQYAFEGSVVRLTHQSHDKWRKAYPAIADLNAALQAADDYYSENPPKNGKWFFPVSQWLKRDNDAAIQQRRRAGYGSDWF